MASTTSVLYLLLASLVRSREFRVVFVFLVIPASLVGVFGVVGGGLEEVVDMFSYFGGRSYYYVLRGVNSSVDLAGCFSTSIYVVYLYVGEKKVSTWLYLIDGDVKSFLEKSNAGFSLDKSCRGECIVAGSLLKELYGVGLNKEVRICNGSGYCWRGVVKGVFWGLGGLGYSLLGNNTPEVSLAGVAHGFLCPVKASGYRRVIASFSPSSISLLGFLSLVVVLSHIPIFLAGFYRIGSVLRKKCLLPLYYSGLSVTFLEKSVVLLFITVVVFSYGFGVSLGVVVGHIGFWALRFIGIVLPLRPLPSLSVIFTPSLLYFVSAIASSLFISRIVVRGWRSGLLGLGGF